MTLSISFKQNCIYFTLVIFTIVTTILFYQTTRQDWILFREAENKFRAKNYPEAIDLYEKSLNQGLPYSKIVFKLADSYVNTDEFEKAIGVYQNYLLSYPTDIKVRLALANILSRTGRNEESELEYLKILDETNENTKTK